MSAQDESLLRLARDWKAGELSRLHPEIARVLNMTLARAGEEAVPFARATSLDAPTLEDLVRFVHGRAHSGPNRRAWVLAARWQARTRAGVHGADNVR